MIENEAWVEAVARALCKADGHDPDAPIGGADRALQWVTYRHDARAAIRALAPLIIERCANQTEIVAQRHARAGGQMVEARAVADAALYIRALIPKEADHA